MDGNQPEANGYSQSVESRSTDRSAKRSPAESIRNDARDRRIQSSKTGNGNGHHAEIVSAMPMVDWKLFADLSLPGENAVYSLHDGHGRFLEATEGCENIWNLSQRAIQNQLITDLLHPGKDIMEWLLNLERASAKSSFPASTISGNESAESVTLKRIPIFIGTDPRQTRIVLKAVASQSKPETQRRSTSVKELGLGPESPISNLLISSVELVNESVVLLMKSGADYRICYANRAFEKMTGFTSSEVAGRGIDCLSGSDSDEDVVTEIQKSFETEREYSLELLLFRKNGDAFWSKTCIHPLNSQSRDAQYCAVILDDITCEKETVLELEHKNIELEETLRKLKQSQKTVSHQENLKSLGQMASGIAHDFNNLLAPILGFSELLLNMPADARDNDKLESFLKKIQVAAQDGAAVVSRLREFYRAHNGEEAYVTIDPETLFHQIRDLTQHRWKNQAEARGVSIQFETDIQSKRYIRANEPELRQAFANLVMNAVDAIMENGTINVSITDKDDRVCIEIKDTGCGMPSGTLEKCLDPFYTTKGQLGTGLGLSIAFGVVKRYKGEIGIDSEPGVGTTISMSFPAVEVDLELEETASENVQSKSLRIMLVDDEAVLLEVISELLGTGGHIVDNFSRPEDALEAFKDGDYDLVITDRAMPGMTGDQLAAEIKADKPDTPVYMVTGFGNLVNEKGEMPPNIDAVLNKPVPLDVLNRKLSDLIREKSD